MEKGKKNWVFCDGDLPPKDGGELEAHEALMVVNLNGEEAVIKATFLFEDRAPVRDITLRVAPERVHCFRLDKPLGDQGFQVPFGQYALVLESSVPIFAVFGRLDTRQPNMAYYTVQGHNF